MRGGYTFKYPHSSREIIDAASGSQGGDEDGGGGDEVVGEGVVEVSLEFEDVLHFLEFFFVSVILISHQRSIHPSILSLMHLFRRVWHAAFTASSGRW